MSGGPHVKYTKSSVFPFVNNHKTKTAQKLPHLNPTQPFLHNNQLPPTPNPVKISQSYNNQLPKQFLKNYRTADEKHKIILITTDVTPHGYMSIIFLIFRPLISPFSNIYSRTSFVFYRLNFISSSF